MYGMNQGMMQGMHQACCPQPVAPVAPMLHGVALV